MRPLSILLALVLAAAFAVHGAKRELRSIEQWGSWRGPTGNGIAPLGDPPTVWSEQQNVRWKIELPGLGHSTPVIWGDRIFVTAAVPHGESLPAPKERDHGAHHNLAPRRKSRFIVLAIDRRDGRTLWERTVADEQPHEGAHETGSWASASPVTDGKRVIASFGSRGIYALDLEGKLLWKADLGQMQVRHGHGEGSSPALHGDTLVVNWDHQGDSFVVALNTRNGKQRWRASRDEITSWSSPLIVEHRGKPQVIVSATNRVRGYDLATGEELWACGGLSRNVVASPVAAAGYVYVANSYDTRAMMAIRLDAARGEITGTDAVAWTRDRDTPYVPSPVLYDDSLCFLKHNQALWTCLEARSGRPRYGPVRIPGIQRVFASPAGAAGRIYIPSRNGATAVVRHAAEFELLALNRLDDSFSASPAIVGDALYLRGERHLYCIGETQSE